MKHSNLAHINPKHLWQIWAVILLLGFPLVLHAQSPQASANYRPALGSTSPALDVYSAPTLKNAPVIIYVHGGGWKIGEKEGFKGNQIISTSWDLFSCRSITGLCLM
jgi:acetyl esterase/lipase